MTRPNIVRADTLDLQSHDTPHAAEHGGLQYNGNIAPHQAAEVQHVMKERHSEEETLRDAWNMAGTPMEEPESMVLAQQTNGTSEVNGSSDVEQAGDGETEEDDDMMDRISSSPSIDDGGYLPYSSQLSVARVAAAASPRAWPDRKASLTPDLAPTRPTFNESPSTLDSSPFPRTPEHSPLERYRDGWLKTTFPAPMASPPASVLGKSLSPFDRPPQHPPVNLNKPLPDPSAHHSTGRYGPDKRRQTAAEVSIRKSSLVDTIRKHFRPPTPVPDVEPRRQNDVGISPNGPATQHRQDWPRPSCPLRMHPHLGNSTSKTEAGLEPSPSLSSMNSMDLEAVLLPKHDLLLDLSSDSGSRESGSDHGADAPTGRSHKIDDAKDILLDPPRRELISRDDEDESLHETSEDINFEFVYALHTFVATVEGQANATKGDTMVLLDDSNSYWWLVRVVKDASIGYLPAEHIETPSERLARLNKHRNIDLSATMLGDNPEKSKNLLKKAIRRRNVKTVQFAAPTYVEASDIDFSSDEEGDESMTDTFANANAQAQEGQERQQQQVEQQANGEPASTTAQTNGVGFSHTSTEDTIVKRKSIDSIVSNRGSFEVLSANGTAYGSHAAPLVDDPQLSPKLVDKTEAAPLKSRKGTPRNTDSFLKDESIETRKITLTPGLLREDDQSGKSSGETQRTGSMDIVQKQQSPSESLGDAKSKKDGKPKKEKKPGMLSGLFKSKKKDKKTKDDDTESSKASSELSRTASRDSTSRSGASSPATLTRPSTADSTRSSASSKSTKSKLQKASPTIQQGKTSPLELREAKVQAAGFVAELEGSAGAYEMPGEDEQFAGAKAGRRAKRAKQRVALDDFDAAGGDKEERHERLSESPIEITSPSKGAFMDATETIHIPEPGFMEDDTSEESDEDEAEDAEEEGSDESGSLVEKPSSESLVAAKDGPTGEGQDDTQDDEPTPTVQSPKPLSTSPKAVISANKLLTPGVRKPSADSTSSATSTGTPLSAASSASAQVWSDASLRAWLDGNDNDVKDMLVVIHDKSGVEPAGEDHPLMKGLFAEERNGVREMQSQLDGLLGDWMRRKGISAQ